MNDLREYKLLIGGQWVAGDNGTYDVVNPATEQVVGRAPEASRDQALAAAAAAAEAFDSWSRTRPSQRAELLNKAAKRLDELTPDIVPTVQAETGALMKVARNLQVPQAAARLRRYAKGTQEPTEQAIEPTVMPSTPLAPGGIMGAVARRVPVGVVTCITSYNFPMVNMAGKIGPALAMGNCVIVKPAPQDPLGVIRLVEILDEVGFPPGVVNVITGAAIEPSQAVVEAPEVDMVSFTGSTAVGQQIGAVCGASMKRQLMELGGKGACIVFDDADLKKAIGGITSVWGFHSGQICTAPTRVFAHKDIYAHLIGGLEKAASYLKVGDPTDDRTLVGPVISGVHRGRIESFFADTRDEGGRIVVGGDRPTEFDTGFFVNPTLIADCTPDMRVVREEVFGPVVSVVPFDDEDEVVALANASDFGLYDYVFGEDTSRAMRVARQLRSGTVGINSLQRNHEAPFGGFRQSGVGRDGGSFGLHAYSETQSIVWPG
ncbi:MAG: aldehyde dehydrogenase family protein [Acidimicrobiia bacterium]|jgi:acyl-CoA reductase-like NAD-dependent aldehyde dehydrogenase|nr:aldehyde dehydrogenase family protein [Acidimicrobiia bacterium]MBP8181877.1 aldehyde dehydrogenase family protein [Acidimicrobiia bacterium]